MEGNRGREEGEEEGKEEGGRERGGGSKPHVCGGNRRRGIRQHVFPVNLLLL